MPVDTITTYIGTLGFPIVMCGVLIYAIIYLIKYFLSSIEKMNAQNDKTVREFTKALNSNTEVLNEIKTEILSRT